MSLFSKECGRRKGYVHQLYCKQRKIHGYYDQELL